MYEQQIDKLNKLTAMINTHCGERVFTGGFQGNSKCPHIIEAVIDGGIEYVPIHVHDDIDNAEEILIARTIEHLDLIIAKAERKKQKLKQLNPKES